MKNSNINPSKIYVAIPYSNINKKFSFKIANKVSALLLNMGYIVYSPISQGHAIAKKNDVPTDFKFWENTCFSFIEWADILVVVMLDKWKDSVGVTAELERAIELKKRIIYVEIDKNKRDVHFLNRLKDINVVNFKEYNEKKDS